MFDTVSFRCIIYCARIAYFLRVIPYKWDHRKKRFVLTDSMYQWYFILLVLGANQLFLFLTFIQEILAHKPLDVLMAHYVYFVAFAIPCHLQIVTLLYRRSMLTIMNQFMIFCNRIEEMYKKPDSPQWIVGCEFLTKSLLIFGLTEPVLTQTFNFSWPDRPLYLSSYFPEEYRTWGYLFILVIPHTWLVALGWSTALFFMILAVTFLYSIVFIMTELRANRPSPYSKDELREPASMLHTYRCIQILAISTNSVLRDYTLPMQNNVLMCFTVFSIFGLIRYHEEFPLIGIIACIVHAFVGMAYLLISNVKLGDLNEYSKKLLGSWKRNECLTALDRSHLAKYLHSCRTIRIEISCFGHYKKQGSTRILNKVSYYTARLLLFTRPKH